jgi:putative two-component system response regulator
MNVLIADDDEVVHMVLEEALTQAGYTVRHAANGREALHAVHEHACRLVISDWEMPEMTGIELCRSVRKDDVDGYVYFILLTSRNALQERIDGLRAGADDFVAKPFEPAVIVARAATGARVLSMETRDVAIFAMAKLAESRDPETGAHLERVRAYARLLSQELVGAGRFADEITPEFVRLIYLTSPLHDIGKVGVPDHVLLKPGRLSDREFEIMKTHTTLGAQTLDAALRKFPGVKFLQMGRDIAASHHERFDGGGYPGGLAADNIPLAGRIVSVADVYDALTSKRVYKAAYTHDIAVSIISDEAGKQFDPVVAKVFLDHHAAFNALREKINEPVEPPDGIRLAA